MRHRYFGTKLSRTKNERARLFAGLLRDLILHGAITTTIAKAKAMQSEVDRLITKAKEGTDQKKKEVYALLGDKRVVTSLWEQAQNRFKSRGSGFTRMIKLGRRRGDRAECVRLSFVDSHVILPQIPEPKEELAREAKPKTTKIKRKRSKKSI